MTDKNVINENAKFTFNDYVFIKRGFYKGNYGRVASIEEKDEAIAYRVTITYLSGSTGYESTISVLVKQDDLKSGIKKCSKQKKKVCTKIEEQPSGKKKNWFFRLFTR